MREDAKRAKGPGGSQEVNGGGSSPGPENPGAPDLSRRESLFAEYVERLNRGESVSVERIREEHPDLAEQLIDELRLFRDAWEEARSPGGSGVLGDYTLRRQIGRGGMGVVYEAWENSMDRRVALKVLPPGIAAEERALQRFVREAKTAGQLNHPNIVAVHGMGVKEQTPYYAMEFVEGETLAQVLARLKEKPDAPTPFSRTREDQEFYLGVTRAFADVADGLQHAHSKGIIHRDIKPSNLILDKDGRLRVLDFGLARLEGQDSLTASGDFVGTPLYMSPEQARARQIPIDHRTDVYSLGATLYEVLTLRPPFQGRHTRDTLSQIIEREPAAPRRWNPGVPKDLETIVLKCLRKAPADRYASAEALAQDLRRLARGAPVEARPQTRLERVSRKLWRRRWIIAGAGAALLAAMIGLIAATLLIASEKRRAEAALEQERKSFRRALGAVDTFLTVVAEEELAVQPGMEATRRKLLESALEFYQTALREKGELPEVRQEAALAHRRMGLLHQQLGHTAEAEEAYRQAMHLLEVLAAERPNDPSHRYELADVQGRLAFFLRYRGQRQEARALIERSLELREALAAEHPGNASYQIDLGGGLNNMALGYLSELGSALQPRQDLEKARGYLVRSVRAFEQVLEAAPGETEARRGLAKARDSLAVIATRMGDSAAAEAERRRAIGILRQLLADFPADIEYRAGLADELLGLGTLLHFDLKRSGEGEAATRECVALREVLVRDFPLTLEHRSALGAALSNLALILHDRGAGGLDEALALLERAVAAQEEALKGDPGHAGTRHYLAKHWSVLGGVQEQRQALAAAAEAHHKAVEFLRGLLVEYPDADGLRDELAHYAHKWASVLRELKRGDEAAAAFAVAREAHEALVARAPQDPDRHRKLANALLDHGFPAESEPAFRKVLELLEPTVRDPAASPKVVEAEAMARSQLAVALSRLGRVQESEAAYAEALAAEERLAAQHPDDASFRNHLGDMLKELAELRAARGDIVGARDAAGKAAARFEEAVQLKTGYERYSKDLEEGRKYLERLQLK